jgi:hypothetical protein
VRRRKMLYNGGGHKINAEDYKPEP